MILALFWSNYSNRSEIKNYCKELINEQNGEEQLGIAECSLFYPGKHKAYDLNENHPKYVTDSIRAINDLRHPGSHDSALARTDHGG